jgi:release factor glutamine methyltransferase
MNDGCFSLCDLLRNSTLPQSEARLLLGHVIEQHYQLPRSALISQDEMKLSENALAYWKLLESKRLNGEPIAYLVGKKGFHNIELLVRPGVLIPRPETELLVEIGLREITRLGGKAKLLDLGTGSGAIALAVASAAPNLLVIATDHSLDALAIAKTNAKYLHLEEQVQFFQGSWYEAIGKDAIFDLILSNPPYIESGDPHLNQGDLRFEPLEALTDQSNGLSCLEVIITQATSFLNPHGLIAVEHGFDQSDAVLKLMRTAGLRDIQTHLDLAGHHRVASGRK